MLGLVFSDFSCPSEGAFKPEMCVPTQTLCCCLSEEYLAEEPSGENSRNSVVVAEHTWAWTP